MKKYIPLLLALPLFAGCLKDEPFKLEYNGFEPQAIQDELFALGGEHGREAGQPWIKTRVA